MDTSKDKQKEIEKLKKSISKKSGYRTAKKILSEYIDFSRYSRTCSIDRGGLRHRLGRILMQEFQYNASDASDASSAFVEIWREA